MEGKYSKDYCILRKDPTETSQVTVSGRSSQQVKMRYLKSIIISVLISFVICDDNVDVTSAFMDVAKTFFSEGLPQNNKFQDAATDDKSIGGLGQVLAGLGNLMLSSSVNQQKKSDGQDGIDLSMLAPLMQLVTSASAGSNERSERQNNQASSTPTFDFESLINIASVFMGSKSNKMESIMEFVPLLLENMNSGNSVNENKEKRAHSSHSWYMPPIIENLHVMWIHFINSELGQTLWKNSGFAHIIGSMTDADGNLKYETILESFEKPSTRRLWIKSSTNFVANWISHISDPSIQQRYLTTGQFIGNSFLMSQGFSKNTLFDASQPAESLTRIINAGAMRYLNVNLDSAKYIKPAVSYIQDLIKLASEKGFFMSRVNANELSSRLSNTIDNDIVSPLLKTYRAYKWAVKMPHCATHIFCVINKGADKNDEFSLQKGLLKISSFPAAWALSRKTDISLWTLYGAIQENSNCFEKYPADCNDFHEEEIRVTTEATHSEL